MERERWWRGRSASTRTGWLALLVLVSLGLDAFWTPAHLLFEPHLFDGKIAWWFAHPPADHHPTHRPAERTDDESEPCAAARGQSDHEPHAADDHLAELIERRPARAPSLLPAALAPEIPHLAPPRATCAAAHARPPAPRGRSPSARQVRGPPAA